jgi:transcriptional antiterminator RfaH
LVRDRLSSQGLDVYLPEVPVVVRRRDRREMKPFFPHYLFARFDLNAGLVAKLHWTPGLRRIVSADGRPVPVPDEVVAALRRGLAEMGEIGPEEPFHRGDLVRIVSGPFEGLEAVFDRRLSPQGRARVFLDLMSRWVATDLDIEDLLAPG